MKKFKVLQILCVFALVLCMPLVLQGCNFGKYAKLTLSQSFKTSYVIGEELNVSGGILKYVSEDGNESYVGVTNDMITGFTTETVGTRNMVITYNGKSITISYSVSKDSELSLSQSFKVYYEVGESLNVSGGMLKYVSKEGAESYVNVTSDMVTGFTTEIAGTRNMIISYNNKNVSVSYSVFKMGISSNTWYISNELAPNYDDRNLVIKFDLEHSRFSSNSAAPEDMPEYGESQSIWLNFTKTVGKDGIVITYDEVILSVRNQMIIKNISDNTFTLIMTIGSEAPQTFTFVKFVDIF